MINVHGLIGIALAAAQVAIPPEPAPESRPPSTTTVVPLDGFNLGAKPAKELTRDQAETLRSQCGDRRFETSAEGMIDGEMKRRKITLCASPGDSNAQWIVKLENAVVWVKAQPGLSDPVKAKLVSDLETKIGQVKSVAPMRALPSTGLPAADALVATVPPLSPSPQLRQVRALQPQVSKPRLSISCPSPGEPGVATPCIDLAADTLLMIRADEDLKTKVSIRFVREGDLRGGVALGMMRRGQIIRTRLPARVCAGVVRSRVEMQTIVINPLSRAEQVADTQGPFLLRC